MVDVSFATQVPPEQVSAQVQQEQEEHQRKATEERLAGLAADAAQHPVPQGALPMPPGFVGYLAQYILGQAIRPVPEVAVVAALGVMAGLAGQRWITFTNSGLNLYIVLVARSAIGKEAMHDGIGELISALIPRHPMAANPFDFTEYASGPALIKAVAQNPCFVNISSELGHRFRSMASAKDGPMTTLRKHLNELYMKSSPRSIVGGIGYSSQENNVESIKGAAYSLLGETTPATFYGSITDAMMEDGLMSRFLVIQYVGERPPENPTRQLAPPVPLVDQLLAIFHHAEKLWRDNTHLSVPAEPDAEAVLKAFNLECDRNINATDDEWIRQLWNRAQLKALRVATLLAVGDNPYCPTVKMAQVEWAITLVRHGNAEFLKRIGSGDVGEGSDGGRERKVLDICDEFLFLPPEKLPRELKHGPKMQKAGVVPRNYLQVRTQRVAAFANHKLGAKAALDLALNAAMANGRLMDVKKDALAEQFSFFGKAFRRVA